MHLDAVRIDFVPLDCVVSGDWLLQFLKYEARFRGLCLLRLQAVLIWNPEARGKSAPSFFPGVRNGVI